MSNFAKVFEIVLHKRIYFHIKCSLSDKQHGFIRGRSTATNLCVFTDFVSKALDDGGQVDTIFTDFSKAFDVVDHTLLLHKMSNQFGIGDGLMAVFKSYLGNRTSFVDFNGYVSEAFDVPCGVPQGSVLGPLLFLLFINDVVPKLGSTCLLYADDLKLFRIISSTDECQRLQNDINILSKWCSENRLPLNKRKCKSITFSRKRETVSYSYTMGSDVLERVESFKDLGVVLDKQLSFNIHIIEICKRSHGLLGFLIRNTKGINSAALSSFYEAFIRTVLEYCSIVWKPTYKLYVSMLERVQRKFLKVLYFRKHEAFVPQGYEHTLLLTEFNYESLSSRRQTHQLVFLYKILNAGITNEYLLNSLNFVVPRLNTRTPTIFYLPASNTRHYSESPIVSMCRLANCLSDNFDIFSTCSGQSLKGRIHKALCALR